ncbi:hypothetical protein [Thiosulfatihalobacter marinus]|uniref:hypothetical protein n=1 Tax=Thiosulfatihalobacter marinus TaxID=2792481 RepID=UPI001E46E118|nr:hypothetical protein [Thiosulfatihalobacter marinus]
MTKRLITAARQVPYSSIVGGSIMLIGGTGACIAQLSIMGVDKDRSDAISDELMTRLLATSDSPAAKDVLEERARQQTVEGWTEEHDDEHDDGEMAKAAACYAWIAAQSPSLRRIFSSPPPTWPSEWDVNWWKPTTPRRDLVKAAALILAEIERIDRAEDR